MTHPSAPTAGATIRSPWVVLVALCVGFFMILLDMTIVAVANPAITTGLHTDISNVIWVTSAYLLTYAVPLLVTGRLGDRFGPKNLYLTGLTVFTLASLWCGLSGTIGMLIAARAVQGLGAALMAPQTMAVITRIFPAERRGAAMGAWGAVAGVATLVGPILGGVLVDGIGWQWIFYVNVPVGVLAFALAYMLVPTLPTHPHKFDIPGVVLSGLGMTMLVFGIQEGNAYHWAAWVWALIVAGVVVMIGFLLYQGRAKTEALVPMALFRDRNFSLANLAMACMGAAVTGFLLPMFFYLQAVRGMSPTHSAFVSAPMAILTGFLAPVIGRLADRAHPRYIPTIGFSLFAISLALIAVLMKPDTSIVWFVLAFGVTGVASACIWAPVTATATRNLPLHQAGAGAGIFNTTRQVGSVLGSAGMGALISARMSAKGLHTTVSEGGGGGSHMPAHIKDLFSAALSESMFLPVGIILVSVLSVLLFMKAKPAAWGGASAADAPTEKIQRPQQTDAVVP